MYDLTKGKMKFGLHLPTQLLFGAGELRALSRLPLPGKRALIVISSGQSMRQHGYLDTVQKQLSLAGADNVVFDGVQPNPTVQAVGLGAELCRSEQCDFVVGLGGGSSLDTAKAIAAAAAMNEPTGFWQFVAHDRPITAALPIVAIPSTAGTGSEIDCWGVLTDTDSAQKRPFGSPLLFPRFAIVDPELTLTVPPRLTAYQGFDAFFHAAEGYISRNHNPISDLYALEAMRLLYKYLPVTVADGTNRWARIKVSWAATLAGMVESTAGCTGQHAMEHAMSALQPKLPHGAGLIALSNAYFKVFKNDVMKRYMKMAEKIRQVKSARPGDFLDALEVMQRECRVNNIDLSQWNLTMADADTLTDNAIKTGAILFDADPRFLNKEEIVAIYLETLKPRK